jgi:hypothetical protein
LPAKNRGDAAVTIRDLLDALDGSGLVLTDDDLLEEALAEMDLTMETEIEPNQEETATTKQDAEEQ